MNELRSYFESESHRLIDKWDHYFDIYDRYFSKFRGKDIKLLEIGIYNGGSLQMWQNYFGNQSEIFGIDINPLCKEFETNGIKISIGSQSDRKFLKDFKQNVPQLDIIIDDGGHNMNEQIISFEELYDHLKDGGVYVCEDLHTSYWLSHGGGYLRKGTFIEYSKLLIDSIHGWHSRQKCFKNDKYTTSIFGMHFYDSILIIEKGVITKPFSLQRGIRMYNDIEETKMTSAFVEKLRSYREHILAYFRIKKNFNNTSGNR